MSIFKEACADWEIATHRLGRFIYVDDPNIADIEVLWVIKPIDNNPKIKRLF